MLFIAVSGLSDSADHSMVFRELRGSGRRNPVAGVAFAIGVLGMVGFPFLGGFASKLYLALAVPDYLRYPHGDLSLLRGDAHVFPSAER